MERVLKSVFSLAAISAIVLMTSCSKENILPLGVLGDPKDPNNGMLSTMPYSPDLLPIPPQRQAFTEDDVHETSRHQTTIPVNSTTTEKTN